MTRRTSTAASAAIACLVLTPALPAEDAMPPAVRLMVERDGSFEVFHSRATNTGTSAVFFGLIGAAVTGSQDLGQDNEREAELLPLLDDPTCRSGFEYALAARLREKQIRYLDGSSGEPSAPEIRVRIEACGFKLVDPDSNELAAFFAAEYQIVDAAAKHVPRERSRLLLLDRKRYSWSELTADAEIAAAGFDGIKVKAGRRLANKFIYDND